MSLFGGDGSAPPSPSPHETEAEHSQPSAPSSPSVDGHASPPHAQQPSDLPDTTDSGDDDELFTDSAPGSDESDEEPPARPNRFGGAPAAWKAHTAADRQIATSLEQIQNRDLAAHLYDAHALKRRVRRPAEDLAGLQQWQSRELWLKRGTELEYEDVSGETQTALVPPKEWTAWPLPPARIPTLHEQPQTAPGSDGNEWVIGRADVQDAGDEMRDEMLATFLRLAKEHWTTRTSEDVPTRESDRMTQSRSRSRSKSAPSARSISRADVRMKDDDNDQQTDNAETQDEDEAKPGHIPNKRRGKKTQIETSLQPAILVDDDRASTILQPAINSVLSKLDDLALAIRRTRLNHFGRGADGDTSSLSEFTSGAESSRPPSRSSRVNPKSRPSRHRSVRSVSRAPSGQSHPATIGDRFKAHSNLSDSGTNSDSDSNSEADTIKRTASQIPSGPTSNANERSPSASRDDAWRAGLIDWSEVLGLAAAKGWDAHAISRTAQRCAALFGETMSLVPLVEGEVIESAAEPVQYTPSTIPAPDSLFAKHSLLPKRPYFRIGTLRCPHLECYGHERDFEAPYRVVEHCIRTHGYDPRTNDSDNEDRTVGGVHIDGFLQPIAAQRGWVARGKARAVRKNRKQKEVEGGVHDAGDVMVIDSD